MFFFIRFCQFVSPINEKKRLIFAQMCKIFDLNYDDFVFIDECTVEMKNYSNKIWYRFIKNCHGKVGRKPHNQKVIFVMKKMIAKTS